MALSRGHDFRWTGELEQGRDFEQEEAITSARNLQGYANRLDNLMERAPNLGLQEAKVLVLQAAETIFYSASADPADVASVMYDLAFAAASAGDTAEMFRAATTALSVLQNFGAQCVVLGVPEMQTALLTLINKYIG